MKRKIFTLAFFAVVSLGNAQTPGYTATGFYDDFATATDYFDLNAVDPNNPQGVYWWWYGSDPNAPASTDPCVLGNTMTVARNSTTKKLELSNFNQAATCWNPMGISTSVDLTNDKTFEVKFTNTSSSTVDLTLAFADASKNILNAYASGSNYNSVGIMPNQTITLSGDLAGGVHKVWGTNCSPCLNTVPFDYTKVVSMEFTITNNAVDVNWETEALTGFSGTFNSVKLGSTSTSSSVAQISNTVISAYPNPAASQVVFSQTLNNVQVYNAIGELVLSQVQATKLDVSSLSQGVYVVNSTEGTVKLVVQ